jgi:hypothetical protein
MPVESLHSIMRGGADPERKTALDAGQSQAREKGLRRSNHRPDSSPLTLSRNMNFADEGATPLQRWKNAFL